MRFWIVIVLALSVALSSLVVAGSAAAVAGSGCAGKASHNCPCKQAPNTCFIACASLCAEAAVYVGVSAPPAPVSLLAAGAQLDTLPRDGAAPGLDPPVPRT